MNRENVLGHEGQAATDFASQTQHAKEIVCVNDGSGLQIAKLNTIGGWRLWLTTACLCLGLFLSALETTIIATALISISTALESYDRSNWIVTAYLTTYTGFLVIFARISDVCGRKTTYSVSLVIFTTFSIACGVARTIDQLIIFRALQGVGGAGLYCLAMSVVVEIMPLKYIGLASGLMGSTFALSSLLGPVLGGVITSNTTWRWVFYLNIPPGVAILAAVLAVFPINATPLHVTWKTLRALDYPGAALSLLGTILLIFGLEQGGTVFPWRSPAVIGTIIASGLSFIGFGFWEWQASRAAKLSGKMLVLFPTPVICHRVIASALGTGFFTGFPFMIVIVFLPQRFQLQQGLSPVQSGLRMLPLLLLSASGAAVGGIIGGKKSISWYILAAAMSLQLVGLGLLSSLPSGNTVIPAQYVYQVITGLGFGLALSSLVVIITLEAEAKDLGVLIGLLTQIRVLGGLVGVAVAKALFTYRVQEELSKILAPDKLEAILQMPGIINTFTPAEAAFTRECYAQAFNLQTKMALGFTAAGLLACVAGWQRNPKGPGSKRSGSGSPTEEESQHSVEAQDIS